MATFLKTPQIREIQVNLIGALYTATLGLHYAKLGSQETTKSIIVVSSLAGYLDDTQNSIFTTSKFGFRGLFRAIRARAKEQLNVRCNLIAPWAFKTSMTAPILEKMKEYGIEEGKGITFVEQPKLTMAAARIASDENISGRTFAVVPEGAFDIGDDIEGGYGGPELQRLMKMRKEAGDFLTG
jgi:5'-hydroxyaverantin dehydrogenase